MSFGNEERYIKAIENGSVILTRGEYRGWLDGLKAGATVYVYGKDKNKGGTAQISEASVNRLMVGDYASPFSRNDGYMTGGKYSYRLFPSAAIAALYKDTV